MKQTITLKTVVILFACLSISGLIIGGSAGKTPSARSLASVPISAAARKDRHATDLLLATCLHVFNARTFGVDGCPD